MFKYIVGLFLLVGNASAQVNSDIVRAEQRGNWGVNTATITNISPEATTVAAPVHAEISDSDENKTVMVSPIRELRVVTGTKLVGTTFTNGFFDYNFWSTSTVNSGYINVSSGSVFVYASTSTQINGTANMVSNRVARFVPGSANEYRSIIRFTTATITSGTNEMRWGVSDDPLENGFFFQYKNGAFGVGYRTGGATAVEIATGAFSGTVPTINQSYARYQIVYTNLGATFYVNDVLVHRLTALQTTLGTTVNFRARVRNVNSDGGNAQNLIEAKTISIHRLGAEYTTPKYKYVPSAATNVLKFGPGYLHHIDLNDPGAAGSTVSIYDSTFTNVGNTIAIINAAKNAGPIQISYDLPFDNGLTVVTGGAVGNITVVYE